MSFKYLIGKINKTYPTKNDWTMIQSDHIRSLKSLKSSLLLLFSQSGRVAVGAS